MTENVRMFRSKEKNVDDKYNNDYFPYKIHRKYQKQSIVKIQEELEKKNNILFVAPNGTGKTTTALSGAIQVAKEKGLKVVYLCRTHAQVSVVIKELKEIDKVSEIRALGMRGKREMCINSQITQTKSSVKDSANQCKLMRKTGTCEYHINLESAINIFDKNVIDADELIQTCKEKKVCPYFFTTMILKDIDIIVCNYNWIFNASIREVFYRYSGVELKNCILIIDECHNILNLSKDLNSIKVSSNLLKRCYNDIIRFENRNMIKLTEEMQFIKIITDCLLSGEKKLLKEYKTEMILKPQIIFDMILQQINLNSIDEFKLFMEEILVLSQQIEKHSNDLGDQVKKDYLGTLAIFWLKWIQCVNDKKYFFRFNLVKKNQRYNAFMEIISLDPREIIIPILQQSHGSLLLSGTVYPPIFSKISGLGQCENKEYKLIKSPSLFKDKNINAMIISDIGMSYKDRNLQNYTKVLSVLKDVIKFTPKNVGIFCASYKVLNDIRDNLKKIVLENDKKFFYETPLNSSYDNSVMINEFKNSSKNNGGVLIGVSGGRNSEGIDYPGDYMNSVVIVGIPYAFMTLTTKSEINYYNKIFKGRGWLYAYMNPALEKSNQGSGRPIRKEDDRGTIIFLDNRFQKRRKFIASWMEKNTINLSSIELKENLKNFWKR